MNEIKLVNPNAVFMLSQANEKKRSMQDIDLMGRRLAVEVKDFLEDEDGEHEAEGIDKITFIAFSLGGLILRAALPRLEDHKEMFHAFVTLSSPHMGYMANDSKLVKTGIWAW